MKISIIVPVYNEAATLRELLCRVQRAKLPPGWEREIIVINDGSKDGSAAVIECFGNVTAIYSATNRGKGAAIRAGLAVATGEVVLVQDSDLEYDPNDYEALLTPIALGATDVVYGSRFLGSATRMSRFNRTANRVLTRITNVLYCAKLTDAATGYKVVRAELLRSLALQSERFEFCSELTAKVRKAGHQIYEVPISYRARTRVEGKKIRARDGLRFFWTLLKIKFAKPDVHGKRLVNPGIVTFRKPTSRPAA